MKDFLQTAYVFFPGASTVGYVDLVGVPDFNIVNLVSIINQTRGVVIYATASPDTKYSSLSGTKVYLQFDTSTHSASDKLQFVYNSPALITEDEDSQNLIRMLSRLVKVMENQQACDGAQRQRVTLDSITSNLTLGTVTTVSGVTTVSTVSTVTTVSSVTGITNLSQVAGMGQEQYINIARNTYANAIRSKLSFS